MRDRETWKEIEQETAICQFVPQMPSTAEELDQVEGRSLELNLEP